MDLRRLVPKPGRGVGDKWVFFAHAFQLFCFFAIPNDGSSEPSFFWGGDALMETLEAIAAVAIFIPVIMDMGGNRRLTGTV